MTLATRRPHRAAPLVLAVLAACVPDPQAGPAAPFEGVARPRNPEAFLLGNGSEPPTPYEVVQSLAIATGTAGMAGYDRADWLRPEGEIRIQETPAGETRFRIELRGLVPGGLYTAWLVRVRGSARGDKRDLALGAPYAGPPRADLGSNALLADGSGRVVHDVTLPADTIDPTSTSYGNLAFWDEVHIAFHADSRAYGFAPGPNHWSQVVLPVRAPDGSALTPLSAVAAEPASGRLAIAHADLGTTVEIYALVTADGLVPTGTYSAWLARADGAVCPLGAVVPGPAGTPSLFANELAVGSDGRGAMAAILTPESACADDRRLGAIDAWETVELWQHPGGRIDGLARGDSVVVLSAAAPDPWGRR